MLGENVDVRYLAPLDAADPETFAVEDSLPLDVSEPGFNKGVYIIALMLSVAVNARCTIRVLGSAEPDANYRELSDAMAQATALAAADLDGFFLAVDIFSPKDRYVKLRRESDGATTWGPAFAFLYRPHFLPAWRGGVRDLASVVSPPYVG